MKLSAPYWFRLRIASLTTCVLIALSQAVIASTLRNSAIVRAVANARPSVVNIHGHKTITTTSGGYSQQDAPRKVNGMGTGVVIDERGYIITNHHVVDGVREIKVNLADGKSYIARLVAHDPQTDLAVIKIPVRQQMPLIKIGTSRDLMVGEEVIAVGNAYGYEHTVTRGIISALHRTVQVTDSQQYFDLIQADASINPGNSGGPLLNIDGEMIGINVAVRVGAQGIGFAIPVDRAMEVAARLLSAERVGGVWHGIVPGDATQDASGVLAQSVQQGSPAALAGITPGDRITRVNSMSIERPLDLERAMLGLQPGQEVSFQVVRQDQPQQVRVQLAAANASVVAASVGQPDVFSKAWESFGMRLEQLPQGSAAFSHPQFRGGLRVTEVRQGGPAAREGVMPGDVLVGMHEWVTASPDDLDYVFRSSKVAQSTAVKFYIIRGSDTLFGHLPVAWRR